MKAKVAGFINLIWDDQEFIIWSFKMGFYRLQMNMISLRKHIVDTDAVNAVS